MFRRLPTVFFLLVAIASLAPLALANGFTLEQVLSSPFPSDLIATKAGDKVAWFFDSQGKRNIWIAEAPQFKGRQLTRYDKDDGQELTEPVFSPDGNYIAYVRGGEENSEHDVPNPTSDPAGAKQEVYIVNTRSGQITRVGEGSAPFFSPKSDRVYFEKDGDFYFAPIGGNVARRVLDVVSGNDTAKKLFEIRGNVTSPAWSPDGSRLAFVALRGDHSFIALYEPQTATIRFLDASVDRDIEPRWSADGKRIAYMRLFNVADTYSKDTERIVPWAIRIVDVATGKGAEIWKSGATDLDSFSRLPMGANQFQWAANDRIVFAAEQDGWSHLYSIPANGGEAIKLTPGEYEVENVAYAPDRSYVIVSANNGDIDHRHLWKVKITGGAPEAITRGNSIEMYPVFADGGKRLAFLHSSGRDPLWPMLAEANGAGLQPIAPDALPKDFPSSQLVEPEQVIIKAADGMTVHCQLFKAKNATGKTPAVVFMHGGPIRQMLLGWHYSYYYHNAYAMNQYLASNGYTVISVNYRAGIGYGRHFREAKGRGPRGATEYQDVVAAGKYLQSRSDVDSKRIGLWGGSYGGFLTAMGLAHNSDIFAAGVDLHGVHDWAARVGRAPWATGNADLIKLGRESSPITAVDKWRSPVLLIHGDDDRNVAFSQSIELVRKLRERGVEFEQLIFPDEVHDFLRHESWLRAYHAAVDFFDRKLK